MLLAVWVFSISSQFAHATNHLVLINEVMAGLNGDSSIQFVELVPQSSETLWGPQGSETVGRSMLVFSDATGRQTGRFVFPSNAPQAKTVLIATMEFAALFPSIIPDFIMPKGVMPEAGQVCYEDNPDGAARANNFGVTICLSYGGASFTGNPGTPSEGPKAANVSRKKRT